jgi:hypothetical protein
VLFGHPFALADLFGESELFQIPAKRRPQLGVLQAELDRGLQESQFVPGVVPTPVEDLAV